MNFSLPMCNETWKRRVGEAHQGHDHCQDQEIDKVATFPAERESSLGCH